MFIISDDVLEQLTCSQCKKYLSVKVIKVYPNRGIKCGRCSNDEDAGIASLFQLVAEEALFRCVNRYEGCNKLLSFSEVPLHEKECLGGDYNCANCPFKGSAYDILLHFKSIHKENLLTSTEFILELEREFYQVQLYVMNDKLFYVNTQYLIDDSELLVNVKYLGTSTDAAKITQMFILSSLDGQFKQKSNKIVCSSVKEQGSTGFKLNIPVNNFSQKVVVCKFELDIERIRNVLITDAIKPNKLQNFLFGTNINFENTKGLDNSVQPCTKPAFITPQETGLKSTTSTSIIKAPIFTTTSGQPVSAPAQNKINMSNWPGPGLEIARNPLFSTNANSQNGRMRRH